MTSEKRAYLELHIAVLLFGFTAILGDLIQLSALMIVWWRVLLTSLSLVFFIKVRKLFKELPLKTILTYMGIGIIVAVHWVTFYGAIKLSNASVGVVAMATASFFTAFLEPLIIRSRFKWYEMGLGLLIIPGMALIVNSVDLSMVKGLMLGIFSAFLAALFNTLNKKHVGKASEISVTFLELSSAWLFLSLVIPFYVMSTGEKQIFTPPTMADWGYILALALFCTTLAYVLALRALRHISAFASNLAINLEPIYGIALAWLLLNENEELTPGFYLGCLIIISAVFTYPLIRRRMRKKIAVN